jgi:hypothetical protein
MTNKHTEEKVMVEIEEYFEGGTVVKRLINGVEYPVEDGFPPELRIQEFHGVNVKQHMSYENAKKLYGEIIGTKGTN